MIFGENIFQLIPKTDRKRNKHIEYQNTTNWKKNVLTLGTVAKLKKKKLVSG